MKVRQYVYLSVHSQDLVPGQIDHELGLTADESYARGSKRGEPYPMPAYHAWKLFSGVPDTGPLNDHFTALFERMRPAEEAIRRFSQSPARDVCIQVVRHFEPGPEDEAVLVARAAKLSPDIEVLRGQHPLLGFDLSAEDLAWLARLGVSVNVDEYGDEYE